MIRLSWLLLALLGLNRTRRGRGVPIKVNRKLLRRRVELVRGWTSLATWGLVATICAAATIAGAAATVTLFGSGPRWLLIVTGIITLLAAYLSARIGIRIRTQIREIRHRHELELTVAEADSDSEPDPGTRSQSS